VASITCAAVVGLFCAVSPHGQLSKTREPNFFHVTTYTTEDYRIEYNRSDLIGLFDLKDFTHACPEKGCLWIKARADRCGVSIQFQDGAEQEGRSNLYYALRSKTRHGLKRGLAETFVRRRADDDASFGPLATMVHVDLDTIACP
jgi:hypothetical protein